MHGKLTLCEYARVTPNGSFDAIGAGVHTFNAQNFPAQITVAILVETKFSYAETGHDYLFEIKIIDPDGKPAGPTIGGAIRVPPQNIKAMYAAFNMQFVAQNQVKLTYSLLINNDEKDSITLEIIPMAKQDNASNLKLPGPSQKP